MKACVLLGEFFLLSLLSWHSSGLEPAVTSVCSDDWLVARIRKRPFDNDTEVRIGDIHLGNSCLVTRMLSFNYEFSYPIIYCGIKKFIFQGNDVFILSEINYKPRLDTSYTFPVVCFMKRITFSSLVTFGLNGHEINLLNDSSQVKRVQQSSISFQSEKCEPDFSSVQRFLNEWIDKMLIKEVQLPITNEDSHCVEEGKDHNNASHE